MSISVTNTKSPITVVDDKVTIKVSSGVGPQGPAGAGGVTTLNSLAGAVTLAVVGGTIAAAGNTLTITVSAGVSSWGDLTGKPFTTLGTGLSVVSGVLSATGLAISDTTGLQAALDAKAPLASPTFTGTVGGITKAMVGLSAVDNTADASKPVSTAQAAADAAVQAYAIQRANHTGTQAVGTITGLGSLATQSGTFSGTSSGTNTGDQTVTLTGDVTGSGTGSFAATLSASGVTAGTYASVTVDAKGRVTAGTATQAWSTITATPTTITGYGITDAATSTHVHGNITSAGAIGSTSGQIVVTTTSGVLTTAATISASVVSGLATVATSGAYTDLSGKPTIPTITSGTAAPSGGSSGDIYLRYS